MAVSSDGQHVDGDDVLARQQVGARVETRVSRSVGGEMVEESRVVVGECSGGWHRLASTMLAGLSGFLSGVLDGVKTPIFAGQFGASC